MSRYLNIKTKGFHQAYHVHQSKQMHVHMIMHDLPHYISAPMNQCTVIAYACLWYSNKQNPNEHQRDKTKQRGKSLMIHKLGRSELGVSGKEYKCAYIGYCMHIPTVCICIVQVCIRIHEACAHIHSKP